MNPELEFCIEEILGQAVRHCERGELEAIPYLIGEAQLEAANYETSDISKEVKRAYDKMIPTLLQGFDEACILQDRKEFDRYKKVLNEYIRFAQTDLSYRNNTKDISGNIIDKVDSFLRNARELSTLGKMDEIKPLIAFAESCAELVPGMDISGKIRKIYDRCEKNYGRFHM